jgi:hypothetical protein
MEFSELQKATIGEWVSEGLKLSDIQSRINETFEVSLTYMDVRFLLDDLELELKDQPKPVDSDLRNAPPLAPSDEAPEDEPGGVSVSLHKLYKPGAVVSGDVVFSDGEKAEWTLDQAGRLGLKASTTGYHPSEEDVRDFQVKLSNLIQNQGY